MLYIQVFILLRYAAFKFTVVNPFKPAANLELSASQWQEAAEPGESHIDTIT